MNLQEFFYMGGYALYVWPSFGLTLVVMAYNVFAARRSLRAAIQQAQRRSAAREHTS